VQTQSPAPQGISATTSSDARVERTLLSVALDVALTLTELARTRTRVERHSFPLPFCMAISC